MLRTPLTLDRTFRNISIHTKLSLLALWAGGVAVALASAAFVVNDTLMLRKSMFEQMEALSDVLGSNSAAPLVFDDSKSATELLASLKPQEMVVAACLYSTDGKVFARYDRTPQPSDLPEMPTHKRQEFTSAGYFELSEPIVHEGQIQGVIFLRASLDELNQQFMRNLGIMSSVMVLSLGTSLLLSYRLQRAISVPIVRLANTAQRISSDGDYSLRVQRQGNDELGALYDRFNEMIAQVESGRQALQQAHNELEERVRERTEELSTTNQRLASEIVERINAERQLEDTHQQLLNAARRAGMAEVATGVLHNVGNVLNSINVSAGLVIEKVRSSRVDQLSKLVDLVAQHEQRLPEFIASDPRGKQIPRFLALLAPALVNEQNLVLTELQTLQDRVDHVKTIVATQQAYASVAGLIEPVDIATTLDDAVKLNAASFDRHEITVMRRFEPLPKVLLDKQKLLQILVNLVRNAKDALLSGRTANRTLQLAVRVKEKRLLIEVGDNGVGIATDNLTRIFTHGFTTKPKGHGFGLHSCANAAAQMEGTLTVQSHGVGQGALFTLELPYRPAAVHAPAAESPIGAATAPSVVG